MLQRYPSQRRLWRVRTTHLFDVERGSRRIVSACEESIHCRLICSNLGHGSYFPSSRDCRVKGDHREAINVTGVLFLIGVFVACFAVEGRVCVCVGGGGGGRKIRQLADILWWGLFVCSLSLSPYGGGQPFFGKTCFEKPRFFSL